MHDGKKLSDVVGSVHGTVVENLLAAGNVYSPVLHCSGISAACGIYGKTVFEDGGRVEGVCVLRKLGSPAVCGYIALDVIVW